MSRELRKVLDLNPEEREDANLVQAEQIESDFEFTRKSYYELIQKSLSAIEDMIDLARQSQNPRAFEVLNAMIKTNSEMNKGLLELQKDKKSLTGVETPSTVNNNLYVGSTTDLAKFLEDKKNANES